MSHSPPQPGSGPQPQPQPEPQPQRWPGANIGPGQDPAPQPTAGSYGPGGQPGTPFGPSPSGPSGLPGANGDDRLWSVLSHLSIFVFGVFGPLIVWLVRKDDSPFVSDHAKEALNFQLSVLIANLVLACTCVLIPLAFVVSIAAWVYAILAAVEANNGRIYRYPYTFRLVQ